MWHLRRINNYLEQVSISLGVDVVWVTNASGDCIASSNSGSPEIFVGTNYADRDYFPGGPKGAARTAVRHGEKDRYSRLVFQRADYPCGSLRRSGGVKIELPKLSHWINQPDAFISDDNGVIILARDPAMEMRSLPGAAIAGVSETVREARYKRTDFPPLTITPWAIRIFLRYVNLTRKKRLS
jgi:C4-dicarboxylate-specific signal transduction histidine kinase